MIRYLTIPIRARYDDDGKLEKYVAEIVRDNYIVLWGTGDTPAQAVRALFEGSAALQSARLDEYVNRHVGDFGRQEEVLR